MDRLISEKSVLEAFREYQGSISDFYKAVKAIPSAEPKWIPVSERLPEEGKDVLACFYIGEGNYKMMVSRRSDYNYWSGFGRTGDMVAWMPLPKPYEPQESEEV